MNKQENVQAAPAREPRRGGRALKIVGCGCLTLVVLLVVLVVGGYLWLKATSDPVPAETFFHADWSVMMAFHVDPEDEGIADVVALLGQQLEEHWPEDISQQQRDALSWFGYDNAEEIFLAFLPVEVCIMSPDGTIDRPGGKEVLVASLGRFKNLFRIAFSQPVLDELESDPSKGTVQEVDGVKVATITGQDRKHASLCMVDHNIFLATRVDLIAQALKHYRAGSREFGGDETLEQLYSKIEKHNDIFGILLNRRGDLLRQFTFLEGLVEQDRKLLGERIEAVAWDLDVASRALIQGTIYFKIASQRHRRPLLRILERAAERTARDFREEGLKLVTKLRAEGEFVVADVELHPNIEFWVELILDRKLGE